MWLTSLLLYIGKKYAWVTRNVQYSVELVLAERRRWVSALSGQFCTIQVLAGMEKLTTWNCWGNNTFIQTGVWAIHSCPDHHKIHIHKASTVQCYILACRLHCSLSIICRSCAFHTTMTWGDSAKMCAQQMSMHYRRWLETVPRCEQVWDKGKQCLYQDDQPSCLTLQAASKCFETLLSAVVAIIP